MIYPFLISHRSLSAVVKYRRERVISPNKHTKSKSPNKEQLQLVQRFRPVENIVHEAFDNEWHVQELHHTEFPSVESATYDNQSVVE